MAALALVDLWAGYRHRPPVVRGASIEVRPGEAVAIMGPSGGGKTTLLKTIAGLVPPRQGAIHVLGSAYPQRPAKGLVGYVPQRLGLVRHTSVLDNVRHGALHQASRMQSLLHQVPATAQRRCLDAIEEVGLADKANDPIHRLSGGQQRRVAIARTLVQRPKLLLADEFLGELDERTAQMVTAAVRRLQDEDGTAVLMVEHRITEARRLADRVFHLKHGILEEIHG